MKKALVPIVTLFRVCLQNSIRFGNVSLSFRKNSNRRKQYIALESGFRFQLEGGGYILMEKHGSVPQPSLPPLKQPSMLFEDGGNMLLENGAKLILETN